MKVLLTLFLTFLATPLFALSGNNVRVHDFKWMHVQTQHFDIYYDESTERLVPLVAKYLEEAWQGVGHKLDFQVKDRTPFFFYSNHNEFEQSTIVSIGEGTGGVTEAFKNRFLVFNDGSQTWLKHVIYHEFVHVLQFNVLYGGFWKSVRLLKSPFYPLWMMEGMAEYGAGDVDETLGDMVVRDSVAYGNVLKLPELHGFAHLKPNQITPAYKTGEAAMLFLKDEYGAEKVPELLKLMKDHFDVSSALEELLGCDIYRFDFRFHEWLEEKYASFLKEAKAPSHYGAQLTFSDQLPVAHYAPVLSPDGKKIYYIGDNQGSYLPYEYDMESKESRLLVPMRWRMFENIHFKGRAMSISPNGRWLAFAGEKKQKDFLYLWDIERKKMKRISVPFDELRSPVFSPVDDDRLAVVGMKRGFNDLYLIDRRGKRVERLTNTPQDERDPTFTKDGKHIIFSGEVIDSTGQPAGRDLFQLDVNTKQVQQLTDDVGEETEPDVLSDGSLLYVRDRDDDGNLGFNIYRNGEKLTNFIGGGFSPRAARDERSFIYMAYDQGSRLLYSFGNTFFTADKEWGDPPRQKIPDAALALREWNADSSSPLLLGMPAPYRFRASTDLFLPFFYYSSLEGFVAANIWQFSDLMGRHNVQEQMQVASGSDFLNLGVFYTYARFRPQLTFGVRKLQYYRDFDEQEQRKELTLVGFASVPLDRVNSLSLGGGSTDRKDIFLDDSEPDEVKRDRFWLVGFLHDTVTGRYLVATRGNRLGLTYQQGTEEFNGDELYKSGALEAVSYVPLARESTFVSRFLYGRSIGRDAHVFRLGGSDRIRGLSQEALAHKKTNVALGSFEMRYRLAYLNARTKFLYPDFFFKAAYLILFDDVGYGWDNRDEREAFKWRRASNSAGVGLSWPTFILQSFQLNLSVLWANRTTDGGDIWYITIAPSF